MRRYPSKCSKCRYTFAKDQRLLLVCPECGSDRRCRNLSLPNGRCKFHSGTKKSGELATNYKHDRRAAKIPYFPKHVQDAYAAAIKSADITSILQEFGIVQARLQLVAKNVKDAKLWRNELVLIVAEVEANRAAASAGDKKAASKVDAAFDQLASKIKAGATDYQWWNDILSLNDRSAELKFKASQAERNRGAVLSATQAIECFATMGRAIREGLLLVKERVARVRSVLLDREEIGMLVDNAVAAIESGGDVRENVEAAVTRVIESIPIGEVEGPISEANQIVQDRIRSMVEK